MWQVFRVMDGETHRLVLVGSEIHTSIPIEVLASFILSRASNKSTPRQSRRGCIVWTDTHLTYMTNITLNTEFVVPPRGAW
jgi:hypothetical protein